MESTRSVIFIICDQLCAIHNLPKSVQKQFSGYQKWKQQCVNLREHYVTNIPCSPSRASIYTGKDCNVTQMTDNNNNVWQDDLLTVNQGLKTMGTYFKDKGYKNRYVGKFHLTKQLDPQQVLKFKPTVATQDFLQPYDFDIFDKEGDAGYKNTGGFYTDVQILQKRLPNGNDADKCDLYDYNNNIAYDGVFPYLISRYLNRDGKFLLVVNFDNPHDITYNDTIPIEENPTSETPTLQFAGNPDENYRTNSSFNENYRMFYNTKLINRNTIVNDNPINSSTNTDSLYVAITFYLATRYYGYGTNIDNLLSYKYYQTSYLQMLKQIDTELEELFDFLTDFGYFNSSVIVLGSDHGELNGSHGLVQKGSMMYRESWQVTTFISYPNMPTTYKGYKHKKITSNIQLLPTVMLVSNAYTKHEIKSLGLYKPIFNLNESCNSDKNYTNNEYVIAKSNFKNLKLGLSLAYGPLFLPLLRSLQNNEVNTSLDQYIPPGINFFTIPGFSVGTDIVLNKKHYNVGYYFSLYNLFITNYQPIEFDKIIPPSPVPLIMYNSISSAGIAFVGTPLQIYQQFFGNVYFVDQYFQNVKIEPFIGDITSQYTPLVLPPTIYGTMIYSNSNLFDESNVATFIDSVGNPPLPTPTVTLYDSGVSVGGTSGGIYCYVGTAAYIKFLMETDPIINTWTTPKIVTGTLPQYTIYVMNDPIYQQAQIYAKTAASIPDIMSEFNLINYIKLLFNLGPTQLSAIIIGNINYTVFDSLQFILSAFFKITPYFTLPGQNMDVQTLLKSGYQVQVFNDTDDKNELYNLADSSRLGENLDLINELLATLNKHIVYHNCETIFLAMPRQVLFTQVLNSTKSFNATEVPLIYNYSLLAANFYDLTKG